VFLNWIPTIRNSTNPVRFYDAPSSREEERSRLFSKTNGDFPKTVGATKRTLEFSGEPIVDARALTSNDDNKGESSALIFIAIRSS